MGPGPGTILCQSFHTAVGMRLGHMYRNQVECTSTVPGKVQNGLVSHWSQPQSWSHCSVKTSACKPLFPFPVPVPVKLCVNKPLYVNLFFKVSEEGLTVKFLSYTGTIHKSHLEKNAEKYERNEKVRLKKMSLCQCDLFIPWSNILVSWMKFQIKYTNEFLLNKNVLLREPKRHTDRGVSSTPYAVLSRGG